MSRAQALNKIFCFPRSLPMACFLSNGNQRKSLWRKKVWVRLQHRSYSIPWKVGLIILSWHSSVNQALSAYLQMVSWAPNSGQGMRLLHHFELSSEVQQDATIWCARFGLGTPLIQVPLKPFQMLMSDYIHQMWCLRLTAEEPLFWRWLAMVKAPST